MKRFHFAIFFLFFVFNLQAQDCSCRDNMQWVIRTIEQNDAGFPYYLQRTGNEAYEKMKNDYLRRAGKITDKTACLQLINNYLSNIRHGHIGLMFKDEGLPWKGPGDPETIKKLYASSPHYDISRKAFEKRLQRTKNPYGPEGVWELNGMETGIIYDKDKGHYVGFVLSSGSPYWQPGHIVLELIPEKDSTYRMVYYQRQRIKKVYPGVKILDGKYILTGRVNMKKIRPALPDNPEVEKYLTYISNPEPSLQEISDKTLLLRIPSFSPEIKPVLDSLYTRLYGLVKDKPYLIIDLRNNGGGLDVLYQALLPLLYTNPMRMHGVAFLSTPLNNARMEAFMRDTVWPAEVREWARESLKKLKAHPGEFVQLEEAPVTEFRLDTVYPSPVHIAVLADKGSGSSAEQFLLEAKQSKKVKIFGTPTAGSLDISNMNWTDSPCGDYVLFYAISRSSRIPGMPVDGIGVQPDFYLDDEIPLYRWIDYAREILEYTPANHK